MNSRNPLRYSNKRQTSASCQTRSRRQRRQQTSMYDTFCQQIVNYAINLHIISLIPIHYYNFPRIITSYTHTEYLHIDDKSIFRVNLDAFLANLFPTLKYFNTLKQLFRTRNFNTDITIVPY